jgi:hypothetical protein
MCRKDLSVKPTPKSKSPPTAPVTTPYSPQRTLVEETGQQITYQEFLDTVAQSNSYQHTTNIEVHPSIRVQQPQQQQVVQKPISKFKKCLKIALCLVIIIVIVVVFITVV